MSNCSMSNALRPVPTSEEEPLALVNGSPDQLETLGCTGSFVAERRFGIVLRTRSSRSS
jgi:hypothetical protein